MQPLDDGVMRGREAEQTILRDLLRRTRQGLGVTVLVEGESGTGKSRLLRDSAGEAMRQGFSLAVGAGGSSGLLGPGGWWMR